VIKVIAESARGRVGRFFISILLSLYLINSLTY
jgi:hypothetical protein